MQRAMADINLAAIGSNVIRVRSAAPDALLLAVVKADGYGHGMVASARVARAAGADYLGVALPTEAIDVRESGDGGRLLCWLYTPTDDLTECIERDVDLSVSSVESLEQVCVAAQRSRRRARIHLKVDTGLGRNGAPPADWPHLVAGARGRQDDGLVEVTGIWSHLACSDEPDSPVTGRQVAVFREALELAHGGGLTPELRHLANSGGVFAHPDTHFDMVRCGISLYGLTPGPAVGTSAALGLIPAMTVTAELAAVKRVPGGHGVSYGHRYRTKRATQLALIPVGYGDGVPRSGSNRIPVQIGGQHFTVSGTIAMDHMVVDIGDTRAKPGDEVFLFGSGRDGEPTADDWAVAAGTINYEIVTRLGPRIPRRHLGGAT